MKPRVILLVNADPEVQQATEDAVMRTRHGLRTAHTSAEALRMLSEGTDDVDLVILDLDPKVHGVALLAAIAGCCKNVPILIVTSFEEAYMKPLALKRGAAECVGKPVTASRFEQLIREHCGALSYSRPLLK